MVEGKHRCGTHAGTSRGSLCFRGPCFQELTQTKAHGIKSPSVVLPQPRSWNVKRELCLRQIRRCPRTHLAKLTAPLRLARRVVAEGGLVA